jgi:hypothetical protein
MDAQPPKNGGPDEAAKRERSRRNIALALALVAFVVLVFVITIDKLGANVS